MSARHSPRYDDLPLADYDELSVDALRHRIRSLDTEELETLLGYEHEHADRVPVTQVLAARLDQLRSGSEPSSGGQSPPRDRPAPMEDGSKVSPASSPEPMGPPPHGTPAQSARPKANRPR